MSSRGNQVEVAIIGAGVVGIATAYYLVKRYGVRRIAIIDHRDPMSLTSAQSGENYRNWWPHPVMAEFTNDSISLMEGIAAATGNRISMTRRGYALATRRSEPTDLIDDLHRGYGVSAGQLIRVHGAGSSGGSYQPPHSAEWQSAPDGVDVLLDQGLIRKTFPAFAHDIAAVMHIRRAGSVSSQQLGQFMLEEIRTIGGRLIRGEVIRVDSASQFNVSIRQPGRLTELRSERIVNAAGPYLADIARFLGEELPVHCVYQQKISFEDNESAVPRNLPFSIDLDGQHLDWTDEERAILASDPVTEKFTRFMTGGIHCRPDGAENGKWIKLGWAFNETASDPHDSDPSDENFPDLVIRAASRLQPKLKTYIGRLPRSMHHYGGYYTMTEENWPLIGPMKTPGAFVAGALSGFGTMAAAASGSVCADWMMDGTRRPYALALSLARYKDPATLAGLAVTQNRGVL
ncbi:MAG: FAD-binding oxidoreductase [Alphaproteobacteria bacterium]|nr:FAD-binding oxidoreductase [Alphaproteobacteria bacterium]